MVKWSETSKKDLRKIYEYIASDSTLYAKKVISTIIKKAKPLNDFPRMGRMVPEIMDESVREILVYQYRVIYNIEENKNDIEVVTIIHGKMDLEETLKNK